jgi:hypothetical protein
MNTIAERMPSFVVQPEDVQKSNRFHGEFDGNQIEERDIQHEKQDPGRAKGKRSDVNLFW